MFEINIDWAKTIIIYTVLSILYFGSIYKLITYDYSQEYICIGITKLLTYTRQLVKTDLLFSPILLGTQAENTRSY